jgi:hypothetical protein
MQNIIMIDDEAAETPTTAPNEPTKEPGPKPSRQQRRASLRDMNSKLLHNREQLINELNRLHHANVTLSRFLTHLSTVVGLQPEANRPDGKNAADLLLDRILGLVEIEKRLKGGQA